MTEQKAQLQEESTNKNMNYLHSIVPKKPITEFPCPICNHGKRRDAKTGMLRDCVACKGTGQYSVKKEVRRRNFPEA